MPSGMGAYVMALDCRRFKRVAPEIRRSRRSKYDAENTTVVLLQRKALEHVQQFNNNRRESMYKIEIIKGVTVKVKPKSARIVTRNRALSPQYFMYDVAGELTLHTLNIVEFIQHIEGCHWDDEVLPHGVCALHVVPYVIAHFFMQDWHFGVDVVMPETQNVQRRIAYTIVDAALNAGDFKFCSAAMNNVINAAAQIQKQKQQQEKVVRLH